MSARCSERTLARIAKVYRSLSARDPWGATFATRKAIATRARVSVRTVDLARAELHRRGWIATARWRRHRATDGREPDHTWTFWLGPAGLEQSHPALFALFTGDRAALHERFTDALIRSPRTTGSRRGEARMVPLRFLVPVERSGVITGCKSDHQPAAVRAVENRAGDASRAVFAARNTPPVDALDVVELEHLTASRAALGGELGRRADSAGGGCPPNPPAPWTGEVTSRPSGGSLTPGTARRPARERSDRAAPARARSSAFSTDGREHPAAAKRRGPTAQVTRRASRLLKRLRDGGLMLDAPSRPLFSELVEAKSHLTDDQLERWADAVLLRYRSGHFRNGAGAVMDLAKRGKLTREEVLSDDLIRQEDREESEAAAMALAPLVEMLFHEDGPPVVGRVVTGGSSRWRTAPPQRETYRKPLSDLTPEERHEARLWAKGWAEGSYSGPCRKVHGGEAEFYVETSVEPVQAVRVAG